MTMQDFDNSPQRNERHGVLALRKRSADHPMVMFAVVVATTFAALTLMPTAEPAFASLDSFNKAPVEVIEGARTTPKTGRVPMTEIDIVCRGQAWGAETADCLAVIEKEARGEARKVRMIANAAAANTTPNVF